jgi:hypothetical protein
MTDLTPSGGGDTAPANDAPLSVREAAEAFAARRAATTETPQPEAPVPDPVEPAAPQDSSHEDTDAADTDLPPVDDTDQAQDDPAPEEPSIEPPRSWTKEEKEAFKLLPPEKQATIADRERKREVDLRNGQNEAAEIRKAAEAERQRLEQARQQYEAAIPQLLQQLNAQQNAEFADIKSQSDVIKLAEDDPFRYAKWDALQKARQHSWQQHQQAQQRQQQEAAERFTSWSKEQDQRAIERIPELADPEKVQKVRQEAISYLKDTVGWTEEKIGKLWNGQETFSARDADFQLILRDAARWQAAQKAAAKATAKPVPPVQRPGTAANKGKTPRRPISKPLRANSNAPPALRSRSALQRNCGLSSRGANHLEKQWHSPPIP